MEQHWLLYLVCVTRLVCKVCGGRKQEGVQSEVSVTVRTSAALQQMNRIPSSCPWPSECSRTPLQREQETLVLIYQPTASLRAALHRSSYINACNNVFPPSNLYHKHTRKHEQLLCKNTMRPNQWLNQRNKLATSFSHFYIQVVSCIIVSLSHKPFTCLFQQIEYQWVLLLLQHHKNNMPVKAEYLMLKNNKEHGGVTWKKEAQWSQD